LKVILAVIPLERGGKELGLSVDILEATENLVVGTQHNLVLSAHFDADSVVRITIRRVEIEDE